MQSPVETESDTPRDSLCNLVATQKKSRFAKQ
jgi:hypothetical protein